MVSGARRRRTWTKTTIWRMASAVAVTVVIGAMLAVPSARAVVPAHTAADFAHPGGASGSDASCPAANPGPASSSTPSAPTQAHAIAGQSSATVLWCPPATGAGQVTSYTVTASDGQQVTAQAPNDWAIVDGLTNGTSYTFTVTASTSAGAHGPAAVTNPVRPEPIAPPRHVLLGPPQTVGYDQYSMLIGGKRVFVTAGEFDPWRTPSPSLWLDDLQKMKADGYNAVTVYFDWDYNSPGPGGYDFTGTRDMNEFLNMAQQAGLYVIARPGPYINAETDGGGIPAWVLTVPNGYRSDTEPYLSAALQWFTQIDAIIAAHQVTKGGNVIAYQIENEYTGHGTAANQYMADLEQQAKTDGITVPFTFNQCCGSQTFTSGLGAVNISGTDNYPLGFNCANTTSFGQPYGYPTYPGEPVYLPEYQGGSFDGWGGTGYDNCYTMTGPAFENVYYKNNIAQGATMQSNYMGVGGTNWGWLPANFIYSSYDYGAAIRETGEIGTPANPDDIAGSKFGENKLINDFETSTAPLTQTQAATAPQPDNPAITTLARTNPSTGTEFVYIRQANATSTATVTTHINLSSQFPVVPQAGTITLTGRDSRLLVANYDFGGQHLAYSTSELMTTTPGTAVVYDPAGTDGETVLSYTSPPTVTVISGNIQANYSGGNLRLDYTHTGLQEVRITGGGRSPLTLLIADTNTAESFWPEGNALVQGGYLIRTAVIRGGVLDLTGDTTQGGSLRVWAPATVRSVQWNGTPLAVSPGADGSLSGTVPGPSAPSLPVLTNWKFSYETPQAQPGFDDSGWTLADHPATSASAAQVANAAKAAAQNSNGTPQPRMPLSTRQAAAAAAGPVLYANDYGYDHGFTWYRGHFTATGTETGVTLTADGVSPTGAFSVWLNGAFLGSHGAAGPSTATFAFPGGAVSKGRDNVIAVLVENTGNPEGPSGEPTGLYSAVLDGTSTAPVTWRLMGTPGGTTLHDPVRGVMNATGLFGTDNGWHLPGYPDSGWQSVALPDSWASRAVPAGVGWYRTSFNLHISGYVPVNVQVGNGIGTGNDRAFIFVNGWLVGRYVSGVGPQNQFYVPAGILNDHGPNTLAIAVWSLDSSSGGLPAVTLTAAGNQASAVAIAAVDSPGYNPAVYGPPAQPAPTLAVTSSSALAAGTFAVKATLGNPAREPLRAAAVTLSVPSGWTVSPSGPASLGNVAPGTSATATFQVTAPASGLTPGEISLLARASYTVGRPRSLLNAVQVEVPYPNLPATFDNTGTTSNSDTNPSPGFIGFDGIGTSYSADGLAADGITPGSAVSAGGLHFTWPNVAAAQPDNTMAMGQTIAISGSGASLGFLAAANNSPESGAGTIYYTDGSTQSFTLDVGNFWYPAGTNGNPANTQVATVNYANYPTGSSGHTIYLFEQNVPLAAGKTVAAVTLPRLGDVAGYNAALHVFALAIG